MEKKKDDLFKRQPYEAHEFKFDAETAAVFDDMLDRSVPFYREIQRMIAELVRDFARPGTAVYDLGCSTGWTLALLNESLSSGIGLVGIDNSEAMLAKARERMVSGTDTRDIDFVRADLNEPVPMKDASVAILNLTLQFIQPQYREGVIRAISRGLICGGALVMVEKVMGEDADFDRLFIDRYYAFKKRQGYTNLEIERKKEALENVLVPWRVEQNRQLLLRNGFARVDVFFKWYNFCGLLAVK